VRFWTKLPVRMLTIFLYNIIYISNLKANLNSLRALHREEVSIYNIEMSLITEADSKKLFYTILVEQDSTLYHI